MLQYKHMQKSKRFSEVTDPKAMILDMDKRNTLTVLNHPQERFPFGF